MSNNLIYPKNKILPVNEAVKFIKSGDTIATSGFVGNGFAEGVAIALEKRFLETKEPKNLTLIYAAGQGDGKSRGLNHFAHELLIKRVIGGHWGLVPGLQKLALENKIEAYNLPQGVISHLFRDIGAHKPRTISHVGLGTFVDPRNDGGKINTKTTENIIELIEFDGKEYLAYKTFPINVAIVRGTTSDINGNISMEKEALTLEVLSMAIAAKNSGGIVIAQVERIAENYSINCRDVKIPGIMVDYVVVSEKPEHHMQTFEFQYNPAFSGEIRVPLTTIKPMELCDKKIIARRAALELEAGNIVNLGIGTPEAVAKVAAEEGILDFITYSVEPGVCGGIPAGGLSFGAATNMEALIDQPYQFDFYDGGGLDISCLGLAQADELGNLNVSKYGTKLSGAGGFINISQNAKKVLFVGTFTAGGLEIDIVNGKVIIKSEGKIKKFVKQVEHITFSGKIAVKNNQPILYITERCVFRITNDGMELIEVAPGIDIAKDIIAQMEFNPVIKNHPKLMNPIIFIPEIMNLKREFMK